MRLIVVGIMLIPLLMQPTNASNGPAAVLDDSVGTQGAWRIVSVPLAPDDCASSSGYFEVEADSRTPGVALYLTPPDHYTTQFPYLSGGLRTNFTGTHIEFQESFQTTQACDGWAFIVASNGNWTSHFVVNLTGTGSPVPADSVASGKNATWSRLDSEGTGVVQVNGSVSVPQGIMHAQWDWPSTEVEAHVSLDKTTYPRGDFPSADITDPIAWLTGIRQGSGASVEPVPMELQRDYDHACLGTTDGQAGEVQVDVTLAGTIQSAEVSVFSIPAPPSVWPAPLNPGAWYSCTISN